jgi:hypothetical protein
MMHPSRLTLRKERGGAWDMRCAPQRAEPTRSSTRAATPVPPPSTSRGASSGPESRPPLRCPRDQGDDGTHGGPSVAGDTLRSRPGHAARADSSPLRAPGPVSSTNRTRARGRAVRPRAAAPMQCDSPRARGKACQALARRRPLPLAITANKADPGEEDRWRGSKKTPASPCGWPRSPTRRALRLCCRSAPGCRRVATACGCGAARPHRGPGLRQMTRTRAGPAPNDSDEGRACAK